MILENLTTTSNNQILETQGMVYTNSTLENDTLPLKNDIEILIPTNDINPNAGIFDGGRDPHFDVMNWAVNNNSVLRNFDVIKVANCIKFNSTFNYPCYQNNTGLGIPTEEQLYFCYGLIFDKIRDCDERCKLLFCRFPLRIYKPFQGLFNVNIRNQNRALRICQREIRKYRRFRRKGKIKGLRGLSDLIERKIRKSVLQGKLNPMPEKKNF